MIGTGQCFLPCVSLINLLIYFLYLFSDGEYLFAEPDSKLSKYAPKSWRSSHSHGLDANGRPALAFYFRVQFYVDSPLLLRDEITRQNYYLQLRLNAASGAAGEHSTHLAGLALQVDNLSSCISYYFNNCSLQKWVHINLIPLRKFSFLFLLFKAVPKSLQKSYMRQLWLQMAYSGYTAF